MRTTTGSTGGRALARAAALLATAALSMAGAVATAEAAPVGTVQGRTWTPLASVDRASTEACVKSAPGESGAQWKLLVRGDNRRADHTHLFGVTVYEDDTFTDPVSTWNDRAKAGRTTKVARVVVRGADDAVSAGIGEVTGEGLGGSVDLTRLARC